METNKNGLRETWSGSEEIENRTEAIEALVAVSQEALAKVREAKTSLIAKLKAQQIRLIRLHAEEGDEVSPDAFREERARMNSEIRAAEETLAETEQRLALDAGQLRLALELAGDVAEVYASADEQTKRGYNQAFFEKLKIKPEWDEETGQMVVRVTGAELTEPYAVLLADDLAPAIIAEAEAIVSGSTNGKDDAEASSSTDVSYFVKLAEGVGFEPTRRLATPNGFQGFGGSAANGLLKRFTNPVPPSVPPSKHLRLAVVRNSLRTQ